jgi:hypothetical protein
MNDDRAQDALRLAEAALADALRQGVTEAEALVTSEDSALTRFANSDPPERRRRRTARNSVRRRRRIAVPCPGDWMPRLRLLAERAAISRTVEEPRTGPAFPEPSIADNGPDHGDVVAARRPRRPRCGRRVRCHAAADGRRRRLHRSRLQDAIAVANSGIRAERRPAHSSSRSTCHPAGGNGYAEIVALDASTMMPPRSAEKCREGLGERRGGEPAGRLSGGPEEYAVVDITDMPVPGSALAVQGGKVVRGAWQAIARSRPSSTTAPTTGLLMSFDYEGVGMSGSHP